MQTRINKSEQKPIIHANNTKMGLNVNKSANLIINIEAQNNQLNFQENTISGLRYTIH